MSTFLQLARRSMNIDSVAPIHRVQPDVDVIAGEEHYSYLKSHVNSRRQSQSFESFADMHFLGYDASRVESTDSWL